MLRVKLAAVRYWLGGGMALLPALAGTAMAQTPTSPILTLPPVEVIGASPLLGSGIDSGKAPAASNVVTGSDVSRSGVPNALSALNEHVAGVSLNDAEGNANQPNLVYRGFSASPLEGNPQGIAVYLNGVRFNQPFSDSVNWDVLPSIAVDRMNLEGSNPVFGLNALGGSLSVQLKNGFTFQGGSITGTGGSFGTVGGSFEYGRQSGNTAAYVAANVQHSDGWRWFNQSDVRQIYGDIGWRGERGEVHLNVLLADNLLNGPGTVPVQELAVNRSASFTAPDQTRNRYGLISLSGSTDITDSVSVQGLVYYENLSQRILNSNTPNGVPCGNGVLCTNDGDPLIGLGGAQMPDFLNGGPYGTLNMEGVDTSGFGAALQVTKTGTVFHMHNHAVAGVSFDGGITRFTARSAMGGITGDGLFIGPGMVIDQPDGTIAPVRVGITNAYYGVYVADLLDVTPTLTLSLSGRLNVAAEVLRDQLGTALNGRHEFTHFNPGIGLSWRITPQVTAYASYAEGNRAPTPAELSCASPQSPCTLANFFVGDPSLKQVVSHTIEAGLRGRSRVMTDTTADWNLDVYRTTDSDDIMQVASAIPGLDFFQNIGETRRQGVEAGLTLHHKALKVWLGYAFTAATFQTPLTLDSPLNPAADANGHLHVVPGDHLPGIPQHRLKFGASYAVTEAWTIGMSGVFSSGQYLFGDEANLNPTTGAYVVLTGNTSYQVTPHVKVFGLVQNVLNARYATFGTFSATRALPILIAPGATETRSLSLAPPIAAYAGVTVTF